MIKADRLNQYRQDVRLRMQVYTLSLPHIKDIDRKDIYEWMPLEFDPTEEERKAIKEKQDKADEEKYLSIIKRVTGGSRVNS